MTGLKTVPNVFVNGEHVGDSQKTIQLLNSGALNERLGLRN